MTTQLSKLALAKKSIANKNRIYNNLPPLISKQPSLEESRSFSKRTSNGNQSQLDKVLVVDDEPSIVTLFRSFFRLQGVSVQGFTGGHQAIDWYKFNFDKVGLIFLDMKMPKISGQECFYEFRRIDPNAVITLMSGFVEREVVAELLLNGADRFVQKPFDFPALISSAVNRLRLSPRLDEKLVPVQ